MLRVWLGLVRGMRKVEEWRKLGMAAGQRIWGRGDEWAIAGLFPIF